MDYCCGNCIRQYNGYCDDHRENVRWDDYCGGHASSSHEASRKDSELKVRLEERIKKESFFDYFGTSAIEFFFGPLRACELFSMPYSELVELEALCREEIPHDVRRRFDMYNWIEKADGRMLS